MMRMSGAGFLAVIAGLAVIAAGVWAQFWVVDDEPEPSGEILVAFARVVPGEGQGTWHLVIASSRNDSERIMNPPGMIAIAPKWSPDGSRLAWIETEQTSEDDPDANIVIWNRATGEQRRAETDLLDFLGFEWSPDSRMLATVGQQLEIWDRDGGVVLQDGPPESGSESRHVRQSLPPSWSPDSRRLSYIHNGSFAVWERETGLRRFRAQDFGLAGAFDDYYLVARREDAFIMQRPSGSSSIDTYELTLDGRSRILRGPPEQYFEFPSVPLMDLLHARHGERANVAAGYTADGRATFGFWAELIDAEAQSSEGCVLVTGEFGEFEREFNNMEHFLRSVDVVIVGELPKR
jgi:hypothetical protein